MANEKILDLYSDYLISAFGQTTATGFLALLNGEISHDSVQRFLAGERHTSVDLWRVVKPNVRKIESAEGVLIVDDSIAEKPYTDEYDIICWHYDHSQQAKAGAKARRALAGKGIDMPASAYGTFKQAGKVKKEDVKQGELGI